MAQGNTPHGQTFTHQPTVHNTPSRSRMAPAPPTPDHRETQPQGLNTAFKPKHYVSQKTLRHWPNRNAALARLCASVPSSGSRRRVRRYLGGSAPGAVGVADALSLGPKEVAGEGLRSLPAAPGSVQERAPRPGGSQAWKRPERLALALVYCFPSCELHFPSAPKVRISLAPPFRVRVLSPGLWTP